MNVQPKTELSREEMESVFADRVKATYGMSVAAYRSAKARGEIPMSSKEIALEVFSGEAAQESIEGNRIRGW